MKFMTVRSKTKEDITLYNEIEEITIPLQDFNKYFGDHK
jgi:hypothetical protein